MPMNLGKSLREKLTARGPVFGAWVGIPHPTVIELMARSNFGFLLLDGEHSPLDVGDLSALLPAAELNGVPTIFRPSSKSAAAIKKALDVGVSGLMVPMIETAEQARDIVAHARYAPMGSRGIGPWRSSGYYDTFTEYLDTANGETTLILQLESELGVSNLEAIAAVEGFDVLFVGPADLASSLRLPLGDFGGEMASVLQRIATAAARAGKVAAIDISTPSQVPTLVEMGYSLFTIGSDMGFIQQSGRNLVVELAAVSARN